MNKLLKLLLLSLAGSVFTVCQGLQCRYRMGFESYPLKFIRPKNAKNQTCSGNYCVYIKVGSGSDIARKSWKGDGYGCQSPVHPECESLGLGDGGCKTIQWETISLFGIMTVNVRTPAKYCCCKSEDYCDPTTETLTLTSNNSFSTVILAAGNSKSMQLSISANSSVTIGGVSVVRMCLIYASVMALVTLCSPSSLLAMLLPED